METAEKDRRNAVRNGLLSCILCFSTGSVYSLGVFSTAVENAASPSGGLNGVWTSGMALISLFCVPLMFFTGVYLSEGSDSEHVDHFWVSKSGRARILSATGAFLYALLGFAGLGVSVSSWNFIQISFIPVGMAMGLFYVESMELLAVWLPHRPGFAIGIGQMMFGVGSIVGSSVFKYLVENKDTSTALYLTAAFLSIPSAAVSPFLQWPPRQYRNLAESNICLQDTTPLSWKQLSFLSSFWLYVITILCMQAGYVFIAYYFQIGQTFGADLGTLVATFQAANGFGTLLRPLVGALVDVLKSGEGFFSVGSKNMMMILYVVQTASFAALVLASWMNSYQGYVISAGLILVVFAAGSCCAPLLAREQFGSFNSSIVFGVGGSISMGFGETAAILMMAAIERSAARTDVPSAYQGYYALSIIWSLAGLVACMRVKTECIDSDSKSESVESPLVSEMEIEPPHRHIRTNSYFDLMTECSSLRASYGSMERPLRSVKVS